jgi:hypothetical protein
MLLQFSWFTLAVPALRLNFWLMTKACGPWRGMVKPSSERTFGPLGANVGDPVGESEFHVFR